MPPTGALPRACPGPSGAHGSNPFRGDVFLKPGKVFTPPGGSTPCPATHLVVATAFFSWSFRPWPLAFLESLRPSGGAIHGELSVGDSLRRKSGGLPLLSQVVTVSRSRISVAEATRLSKSRWDAVASDGDRFVEEGHDYHRHRLHGPGLTRVAGPVRGRDVLDIGCGQGWFSRILAARGAKVTGVDRSASQVKLAERHDR